MFVIPVYYWYNCVVWKWNSERKDLKKTRWSEKWKNIDILETVFVAMNFVCEVTKEISSKYKLPKVTEKTMYDSKCFQLLFISIPITLIIFSDIY